MKKYHLRQKMAAAMCAAMLLTQAAPTALAEAVLIRPGEDALSQALAEQYQASQTGAPAAQSEQQNNPAPASLEPQQQDESGETQQDGETNDTETVETMKKIETVKEVEENELTDQGESDDAEPQQLSHDQVPLSVISMS